MSINFACIVSWRLQSVKEEVVDECMSDRVGQMKWGYVGTHIKMSPLRCEAIIEEPLFS